MKKLVGYAKGLLPRRLPVGMAEFEKLASDLENTYDLPTKDSDSVRFTLGSIMSFQKNTEAYRSLFYFYKIICTGAAKQIGAAAMQDAKARRDARIEAEQKALEATNAETTMVADGSEQ
jgi:hypothetical protein